MLERVEKSRKFHDAWAFILYIVFSFSCNFYYAMGIKSVEFSNSTNIPILLIEVLLAVVGFTMFTFMAFTLFPKFYLWTVAIVVPILSVGILILNMNIYTLIMAGLSILFWIGYWILIRKKIEIISKVIKSATKVLMKNVFAAMLGILICAGLQFVQFFLLSLVDYKEEGSSINFILFTLNLVWTLTNCNYFFDVFISSIVAFYYIEDAEDSILIPAFKNSFYALGSICFAGLIFAIIKTAQMTVDRERSRQRRNRENLLATCLLFLLSLFLAILGDIVNLVNSLTMPYLAIHGTNYRTSVSKSFELVSNSRAAPMLGLMTINMSLQLTSILFAIVVGILAYFHVNAFGIDISDSRNLIELLSVGLFGFLIFIFCMMMFSSAFLSTIYMYTENPELVKRKDPKLAEAFEKTISVN